MNFDGTGNEYLEYTPTGNQTSLSTMSISAWLNPDNNDQYKRHFEFTNGATDVLRCEFDNGFGFVFIADFSTTPGRWSTNKISTNTWTHHLITYDNSDTANDPTIYLDGVDVGVIERVAPVGTGTSSLDLYTIGANSGGGSSSGAWDGDIKHFGIVTGKHAQ